MKKIIVLLVLCGLFVGGCSGVIMSSQFSKLLDQTADTAEEVADRADAGELSEMEMKRALRIQANTWRDFQKAKDGKK